MDLLTPPDPSNFGNGAWPEGHRPTSGFGPAVPEVLLRRVLGEKNRWWWTRRVEVFELLEPIRYRARLGEESFTVTVPQPSGSFTTDFTSVPPLFTWLVPRSGEHLPAAIIHDGLVRDRNDTEPTYTLSDADPGRTSVDRIDADAVFRDAMRDTGVGRVRRWLVWAAVTTASLYLGPRPTWRWYQRLYFWLVCSLTFVVIGYLGAAATADLLGAGPGAWWWGDLPWIPEAAPLRELAYGFSGAVVVPLAMSVAWLRYWRAGAVAGVALATLIHVTVGVAVVAGLYWLAEAVLNRRRASQWVLLAAVVGALVLFVSTLV